LLWETETLGWKFLFFLCGDGFWPLRPKRLKIESWVIYTKRCTTLWRFQNCLYFLSSSKTVASTKKRDFVYIFEIQFWLENHQWTLQLYSIFRLEKFDQIVFFEGALWLCYLSKFAHIFREGSQWPKVYAPQRNFS
jgi:hypothetical protein